MTDRILIVEDEADLAELVADVLESAGYLVEISPNGREALRKLKSGAAFSVVLSDLAMPEMDGLTFLQQAREQGMEIPFVLFSGTINKEHLLRAHQFGVFGVLEKPSSPPRIIEAVRGAVEYGHLVAAVTEEMRRIFARYGVPEAEQQKLLGMERALTKQRVMGQFLHL